jgi:hypothetical protein
MKPKLVVGLYARARDTGEIWWYTGSDTALSRQPHLRPPTERYGAFSTWQKELDEAMIRIENQIEMWWCSEPRLFETTCHFEMVLSEPLPTDRTK